MSFPTLLNVFPNASKCLSGMVERFPGRGLRRSLAAQPRREGISSPSATSHPTAQQVRRNLPLKRKQPQTLRFKAEFASLRESFSHPSRPPRGAPPAGLHRCRAGGSRATGRASGARLASRAFHE